MRVQCAYTQTQDEIPKSAGAPVSHLAISRIENRKKIQMRLIAFAIHILPGVDIWYVPLLFSADGKSR